ncbi:aspartyl protease family protein [Alteromonas sp. W364]|uniref:aspartyl protease family protein n=1 Tax=Alteromonas sp. W364 TaxID=3075610 RepID=UPI002888A570|nr:aspartyl protease family protein [Alteromonas sp. W364]MDT0629535.1 aspartyl protease family protein [Alteromonas sp. W364]
MTRLIRTMCFLLFTTMSLSACSIANSLRMMNANNGIEPIWNQDTTGMPYTALQAFYIGEKPYIKVKANGQQELLFLIDTGASFTMLFDTKDSAKLTFERGFSLEVAGWGEGKNTPAYQTELRSLSFGDIEFKDVKVAYIPISTSQYYMTPDEAIFDGVLGHDLLQHFVWTFDKREGLISASELAFSANENDVVLPFDVSLSKLSIPVSVTFNDKDTINREVLIDTGSRHYMKLNSAFPKNNDIELPKASIQAADFGLSGKAEHIRVTLPKLELGSLVLHNVKANIIDSNDEDDWWIIGSALMNQFVTIFDYPNKQFVIRQYPHMEFITKFNLAGIDLRKLIEGNFLVRYVYPGLPGELAGLKAGQRIMSINGIQSNELSEQDWLEMNAIPSNFVFCFEDTSCQNLSSKHISGYSDNEVN